MSPTPMPMPPMSTPSPTPTPTITATPTTTATPEARWEGERADRWARWWGIPALEVFHTLPSTNTHLRERAVAGAPPFTAVVARTQTGGRGRGGRPWHSPSGLGLWVSILLEPPGGTSALPVLPLRVGLALTEAVEVAVPGCAPLLKWPNDLYVRGRKAAGILCEVVPSGGGSRVVVGVGVNLLQDPSDFPSELRRVSISLGEATGRAPDRALLLGAFLSILRGGRLGAGPVLSEGELDDLRRRDLLRGRPVRVDPGGEGVSRGIGEDGALLLEQGDGEIRRVMAGSVRLVEPSGTPHPHNRLTQ